MQKIFMLSLAIGFVLLSNTINVKAQTAGTLTFTYTQTAPSASATKNVMAVWIEDNSGTFVKTKMRYWSNSTNDHLPSWVSKSAQNVVDATTGATRTASTVPSAFGAKTITWDGKNAAGTLVPDGVYKVFVESSYCNPEPSNGQHWIITSFTFTKGTATDHQTPTGPANFSNISLDWVPNFTAVEEIKENSNLSVYPNPTKGSIVINYKDAKRIVVENILGSVIYYEKINTAGIGSKNLDLKKYSNGVYVVKVESVISGKVEEQKVLLNK